MQEQMTLQDAQFDRLIAELKRLFEEDSETITKILNDALNFNDESISQIIKEREEMIVIENEERVETKVWRNPDHIFVET